MKIRYYDEDIGLWITEDGKLTIRMRHNYWYAYSPAGKVIAHRRSLAVLCDWLKRKHGKF